MTIFSLIIPVKELNDYVRETVPYILSLDFADWELFIVTNENQKTEWPNESRIKMLSSGRVGPAEKRDIAAAVATGQYIVFLDDDIEKIDLTLSKITKGKKLNDFIKLTENTELTFKITRPIVRYIKPKVFE